MATEYKVNVINMDNIESYIAERDVKQRGRWKKGESFK